MSDYLNRTGEFPFLIMTNGVLLNVGSNFQILCTLLWNVETLKKNFQIFR